MSNEPMPMTDEQLRECRTMAESLADSADDTIGALSYYVSPMLARLVAEVERLRAENAAMRPIVEAVAALYPPRHSEMQPWRICRLCGAPEDNRIVMKHEAWCPIEQARAFVAAHPATMTGSEVSDGTQGHTSTTAGATMAG